MDKNESRFSYWDILNFICGALYLEVKLRDRGAHHSPSFIAELNKDGVTTSLPQYIFMSIALK
jgi:hypothetical protein